MIKVVVIGSNGLVGNSICQELINNDSIELYPINRFNIQEYWGFRCDILINANGSSRKNWCNLNSTQSFKVNCLSFYEYMERFIPDRYILISSVDIYSDTSSINSTHENVTIISDDLCTYGLHKYIAESLVKNHYNDFYILRLSAVVSSGLKKNALYDITRRRKLMLSPFSKINFIDAKEVAEVVSKLLFANLPKVINCASSDSIKLLDIINLMNYQKIYNLTKLSNLSLSSYEIAIDRLSSFHKVRTSQSYVEDYIRAFKLDQF